MALRGPRCLAEHLFCCNVIRCNVILHRPQFEANLMASPRREVLGFYRLLLLQKCMLAESDTCIRGFREEGSQGELLPHALSVPRRSAQTAWERCRCLSHHCHGSAAVASSLCLPVPIDERLALNIHQRALQTLCTRRKVENPARL